MRKYYIVLIISLVLLVGGCSNYLQKTVQCKVGEDCNQGVPEPCEEGYLFSQKDCECVEDPHGCKGLDKVACELNPNCYSFSRSGTCSCPMCESWLAHQCLPK